MSQMGINQQRQVASLERLENCILVDTRACFHRPALVQGERRSHSPQWSTGIVVQVLLSPLIHNMFFAGSQKIVHDMMQSSEDPGKPFIDPRHEPFPLSSRSLCYLFIPDFNQTDSFQQSSADTNNYLYE